MFVTINQMLILVLISSMNLFTDYPMAQVQVSLEVTST